MIRIFQKEDNENKNVKNFISALVNKNIRIASVMIRNYAYNGVVNWFHDCWIYFLFWKTN